jgi:hypothetical protein
VAVPAAHFSRRRYNHFGFYQYLARSDISGFSHKDGIRIKAAIVFIGDHGNAFGYLTVTVLIETEFTRHAVPLKSDIFLQRYTDMTSA